MILIQTKLSQGNTYTVCWLPQDRRIKIGSVISFIKGGDRWKIDEQWGREDSINLRHGWPVGGL